MTLTDMLMLVFGTIKPTEENPAGPDDAIHTEGCVGRHCARCGWCEIPGEGQCICYAR